MSETRSEVRQGAYYDSVVLMQLQRSLAGLTWGRGCGRGNGNTGQLRYPGSKWPVG